jgi:predicted Zn-dependent protease
LILRKCLALSLACAFAWVGVKSIQAERHFTQVQSWVSSDLLQAFMAANAAYQAQPWESRYRVQLALSLESLMVNDKRARLTNEAADKVWRVSRSASPDHPAVLVARAQYLLNSGRWKDSGEINQISETLRAKAKTYPQTWMVEAYLGAATGDTTKAIEALMEGMRVGGRLKEMQRVANAINMEIEEK